MINLKNKNIIITGASGGIGNSIVKKLSEFEANILATGTKIEKLEDLKSKIKNVEILSFDISQSEKIEEFIDNAKKKKGRVDYFKILGINSGETLTFTKDQSFTCEVKENGQVLFREELTTLSGSALKILTEMGYNWQQVRGAGYWCYKGTTLLDLYQQSQDRQMTKAFDKLSDFILNQMRMSHIYQPVMLIEILKKNGSASTNEIAKALLSYDTSQVEYYEHITNNMVGKVLTKNRGVTSKDKNQYHLNEFENLDEEEIEKLISFCEKKIENFIGKRGDKVWEHRKKSSGYVSGTLRYEILKRAKFRCELCGISAEQKALEVDHIVPRNSGGTDDESNLQSLCYSCNAMKRDRDDTDFRGIGSSYEKRERKS